MTISASRGLGLLQMTSEPDTGRSVSEEAGTSIGEGKETSTSKDIRPRRGMDCEIPHRLGRRTKHFLKRAWKPLISKRFKTFWGSLEGKAQRGQYWLAVGLCCYRINGPFELDSHSFTFYFYVLYACV